MSGKKARKPRDRTPVDLLDALAAALNACEQGDVKIRLHHGSLLSEYGVILPPGKKGRTWDARMFAGLPMAPEHD